MRIESGEARGRILQTPNGNNTRPTDGRTRGIIFNSLGDLVIDARFLDLYAGCGSVGLEALSRGAKFVFFVEQEHSAIRCIRANLKTLGWEKRALVWHGNARSAIPKLVENGEAFEIVFADPPFTLPNEGNEVCARIDAAPGLLNNELVGFSDEGDLSPEKVASRLIVQHSHRVASAKMTNFELIREKKAGESTLSFYEPNINFSNNN